LQFVFHNRGNKLKGKKRLVFVDIHKKKQYPHEGSSVLIEVSVLSLGAQLGATIRGDDKRLCHPATLYAKVHRQGKVADYDST